MKTLLRYILFFVLAGISTVVYAQYYLPTNRIGLEIGGGLAGLLNRNMPNNSNLQLVSNVGGGLMLGINYELQYRHLIVQTGFGINYSASSNSLYNYGFVADVVEYSSMKYHYDFSHYTEQTTYGVGYIPLKVGAAFKHWYFLAGAKIGIFSFANTSAIATDVKIWASDQDVIGPLQGMPNHGLQNLHIEDGKKPIHMAPFNAMLSAEIGMPINSLINLRSRKYIDDQVYRLASKTDRIQYRLAIFADFGLNNLYKYTANPIAYNADRQGGLVAVNGVNRLTPYSIYGFQPMQDLVLNNLLVGIKLSMQLQLPNSSACRCER